jgi:hypothetical protein
MIEKSDKNKEAWTTFSKFISLRFGLCSNGYSTFDWFWKKEEFKKVLAILRKKSLIGQGPYEICRVQKYFLLV